MNHDLTGIKDLLKLQKEQIKRIKFLTRVDNEKYLREHPEIEYILGQYLVKLLEDRPANTLKYSGEFFNKTDFRTMYEKTLKKVE
jgi:hypothetical protein